MIIILNGEIINTDNIAYSRTLTNKERSLGFTNGYNVNVSNDDYSLMLEALKYASDAKCVVIEGGKFV